MSLRLYVYYSGVLGGWAGFLAWGMGRLAFSQEPLAETAVQHLLLGGMATSGLTLTESLTMSGWRISVVAAVRCMAAGVTGLLSGLLGGLFGYALSAAGGTPVFFLVGWISMGALMGTSLAALETLERAIGGDEYAGDGRRFLILCLGGAAGATIGGILALLLAVTVGPLAGVETDGVLFSGAAGFTMLGACLGLFPAAARVVLRRAWLRIESGPEQGREMILGRSQTVVGRTGDCDLRLADQAIEPHHAKIVRWGSAYLLTNLAAQSGTFLNDKAVSEPTMLRGGDRIRLGNSVLVYHERRSTPSAAW